jgi:hypothetical protein
VFARRLAHSASAKAVATQLLATVGYPADQVVDAGDITSSRYTEASVVLWLRYGKCETVFLCSLVRISIHVLVVSAFSTHDWNSAVSLLRVPPSEAAAAKK